MNDVVGPQPKLNEYEEQILLEVAGVRPTSPWGAWVGACLEFLKGDGYLNRNNELTPKGRVYLVNEGYII
jgi:hypothetical protein